MKGKWSAFYLKAFPFVRTGVKSVEPSICVCVFIINWNVLSISLSICIVTVCFISCIFVILSCLVCRLSMSTRSRFGRQFVLDFVFNINIRFKEHAKLNKSLLVVCIQSGVPASVPVSITCCFTTALTATHLNLNLNHVCVVLSSLDFLSSFSVSFQVSRVLVASLIRLDFKRLPKAAHGKLS